MTNQNKQYHWSILNALKTVDWEGKLCLIEASKVANIQRFIFFSAQNAENFTNIPLMKLKYRIEEKLKKSEIPYTIFRLTGFYQGLIFRISDELFFHFVNNLSSSFE